MLRKLLTHFIVWAYGIVRKFTRKENYTIDNISLEYTVDNRIDYEIADAFWEKEFNTWKWDEDVFTGITDVTRRPYRTSVVPGNVTHTIVRVKYWYNNQLYKYITNKVNHAWPPADEIGMNFSMPIKSVFLVDEDLKPMRDITEKYKRYSGPKGNFHNEDIPLRDILFYDSNFLVSSFPYVQIKRLFSQDKVYKSSDVSTLQLL